MAIISCSNCGQQISEESPACPLCGVDRKDAISEQQRDRAREELPGVAVILIGVVILTLVVIAMFAGSRALALGIMILIFVIPSGAKYVIQSLKDRQEGRRRHR